ncbi:endonuclease/exonuclease/phosphatase family protein [Mediterraneibacter glycyrrhizinilyticus]|uniref:hypothetical protein n=1 Tax=Mediterraneibacter glycyrrhizinilyticus TaxID=342942 RepID=UPI002657E4FF|nr:hypothetical protein [Mediterraneibacter glycyrrhizinilyticus]MCF2567760.1 endonuclease/exonuclease/phosphatase family protein [Mediterraneibacter glycyrrhizinilyticus]
MKRKKLLSGILALSCAITLLPAAPVSAAEPQTGNFTAVSMNVDGLPTDLLGFININEGGPGPNGTRAIGQKMAEYGWDIIGVSEDFNYNDELMEALSEDYNAGTHRGGVSWLTNNTDGLNLLWKKSLSVTGESWTKWNTQYSTGFANTGNGADGMINKGFRYYEAEVADGVYVDFYILHMDADSDQGDIDARHAQLTQLADAIKASDNENPIIVMGDTNCRYTREDIRAWFMDPINADERFEIKDAWVEDAWNGTYPNVGEDALMAVDKGGTYQYPQAEIVDKIFYINNTDSQVKLALDSYDVATDFTDDSGTALADHWPIVGTFTYTVEQEEGEHVHSYVMTEESPATCTEEGHRIYICACGASYEEPLAALGHDYQISSRTEATCTEPGEIVYTCGRCGDSYPEMIPAAGHNYQGGVCTNCGAQEPSAGSENVFGETAGAIESGSRYALVTSSSTQNFALTCGEDGTISWAETETAAGTGAADGMAWTVEKSGSGYTISTEINGMKKYLARTNSFVGYGYKVALQDSPFVWNMQYKSATDGFRVSTKILFKNYALRYYNSKTGWIVTTKGMDIQLYNLAEQTGQ